LLSRSKDEHKLKRKLEELKRWAGEVGIGAAPVLTTLRERITAFAEEAESTSRAQRDKRGRTQPTTD
jgi:hypothetical protein